GHFEAWVKALPLDAMNKAADKPDKELVEQATQKVLSGYIPPLGLDQKLTKNQITDAVIYEQIANEATIEPTMRMLEEIDCTNRMFRHLSVRMHQGTKTGSVDTPGPWKHIAPETNLFRVQMALCR